MYALLVVSEGNGILHQVPGTWYLLANVVIRLSVDIFFSESQPILRS